MQKLVPCLCFDTQAEEAAKFYTSIFKNSKIKAVTYYGDDMPMPKGTVLTVIFELDGMEFMALNAGPSFQFTPATSLMARCDTQKEIDEMWVKLQAGGGREIECGWVQDKYGFSWQVVPAVLEHLMTGNQAKTDAVMREVMQMKKLDIARMKQAYDAA
jgi:predicted 3-demethylubiquinone-9 3-methyltransferase (glyoxalase superfamily)